MTSGPSFHVTRLIFLRMMAACYLVAFVSIYVQWPGLYSCSGVEPVHTYLQKVQQTHGRAGAVSTLPTLAWLHDHEWIGVDVDVWMEALCLMGATIAAGTLLLGCDYAPAYAALLVLYSSIQAVGQNFLSFQWDILLLETGAIAVLLGAWVRPCFMPSLFTACDRRSRREAAQAAEERRRPVDDDDEEGSGPPATVPGLLARFYPAWTFNAYSPAMFLARFLLFRLMFASGVVKVLSQCVTWGSKLTAMEYHYATQCLPTPLAWFAHQLPPSVQQLTTAGCIFVEVVGALLILTPSAIRALAFPRQVAYATQAALQVAIMLTGNYTFFNWLTLALIATLVSDQEWRAVGRMLRPWLWCSAGEGRISAKARPASRSATASSSEGSAVEMARVGKDATKSSSSSAAAAAAAAAPKKFTVHVSSAAPPSMLFRAVWFLLSLALKLSVLGALVWAFLQMYRVELVTDRSSGGSSGSASVLDAWKSAPSIRGGVSLAELPYVALHYLYPLGSLFRITPRFSPADMQRWMDQGLTGVVWFATALGAATLLWSVACVLHRVKAAWVRQTARSKRLQHGCARRFVARMWWLLGLQAGLVKVACIGLACAALFAASLVPFMHSLSAPALYALPYSRQLSELYSSLQPYHLTNSYGLFRSMTGVGPDEQLPLSSGMMGATKGVTTVARPELVLEGSNDDGTTWHEIPFRHKPSADHTRGPSWVAPHQPRLDWQMWFSALAPSSPPWLIHLVWRILEGQGEHVSVPPVSTPAPGAAALSLPEQREQHPVWDLLAPGYFTPSNPPAQVRIQKQVLDFTRIDGCDEGRNAAAAAAAAKSHRAGHKQGALGGPSSTPLRRGRFSVPSSWWRETQSPTAYLPPVDLDNPSLQNFLAQNHWVQVCARMRTELIRKKAKEQKEKIFEATPEKPAAGAHVAGAAAAQPPAAQQVRKNHIFTAEARPWHLSYYLAWLELHAPSPATYAPHARTIKAIVQRSRAHLHQLTHNEWSMETITKSMLLQMIATSTLVVMLVDLLFRG